MSKLFELQGRTAIVTGAGGGIGAAISASLAKRGCHLALGDIDTVGLARTAETVKPSGVRVSTHVLDVGDGNAIASFPAQVLAEHAAIDVVVNNAGVALGGTFEDVSPENFDWLMGINFWGVVRMTRAFLPHLKTRPEARIVNLSSLFGLVAPPGQTAYAASKFAVRGFSEALRHELERSPVGITVVHPGGVRTSIARSSRAPDGVDPVEVERDRKAFEKQLKLPAETAGEIIVKGIEARRARIIVGSDAKLLASLERLMPVGHWGVIRRLMGATA